jgi:hypothetical protein
MIRILPVFLEQISSGLKISPSRCSRFVHLQTQFANLLSGIFTTFALHFVFSGFRSVFHFSSPNYFLVLSFAENSNWIWSSFRPPVEDSPHHLRSRRRRLHLHSPPPSTTPPPPPTQSSAAPRRGFPPLLPLLVHFLQPPPRPRPPPAYVVGFPISCPGRWGCWGHGNKSQCVIAAPMHLYGRWPEIPILSFPL